MNFPGNLEATVTSRDTYCWDFSGSGFLDSVRIFHQERKTHSNIQKSPFWFKSEFPLFPNYSLAYLYRKSSTSYFAASPLPLPATNRQQRLPERTRHNIIMSLGAFLGLLLLEEPESRQPSLVQRSRSTVLELWASPDLLRPPGP